jgi:hypothetical protein
MGRADATVTVAVALFAFAVEAGEETVPRHRLGEVCGH